MATIDELLKQAIAALKGGRKAEARQLLAQVLNQDPRDEKAWLWMSGAVETEAERRVCLEKVLAIDPDNEPARAGLAHLNDSESTRPSAEIPPPSQTDPDSPSGGVDETDQPGDLDEDQATSAVGREPSEQPPARGPSTGRVSCLAAGLVLFGLISLILAGVWWAIEGGFLLGEATVSAPAGLTLSPTTAEVDGTRPSSRLSLPTWTPSSPDVPATSLPTRTPRPTNTPLLTWTPTFTPTATLSGTFGATETPDLELPATWTPRPTSTPPSGLTPLPTWTPSPTYTVPPALTLPPTWTPPPTHVPAATATMGPTWTPRPTSTPVPGLTIPPTWTPRPTITPTLTLTTTAPITSTPTLTSTLATATPSSE